jgi:myo-inositol-1(or 4)-monophosphatase
MHPLINIAVTAAREAGDIIMQHADRIDRLKIREKSKNDLVTEVDLKAEQAIISHIHKAYPTHGIIAEESGIQTSEDDDFTWIIDPLDGTSNFIHGFPHYAVSIAIKHKDKIEHGVVYDPVRKECFQASRGRGAQLNDKKIRVSKTSQIDNALLGTGFPFRNKALSPLYFDTFKALFEKSAGIRRAGAAALDLAYVASGRLDGFWEFGLKPWDIAAGSLLIKESGGLVSDINGFENYLKTGEVIAAPPKIFKAIIQTLNAIIKEDKHAPK